ncbi:MAG: hypothetical protein ACYTGQ_08885 [Planctomycetota bacterium]|jgi:hypothetical protein
MQNGTVDPKQVLLTSRVIWFALCLGVGFMWVLLAFLIEGGGGAASDDMIYLVLAGVFAVVSVPAGWVFRKVVWEKGREDGAVSPQAYQTGCVISWACCEGVTLVGLIFTYLMVSEVFPIIIVPIVTFLAPLAQFPSGKELNGEGAGDAYASGSGDKYGPR